MRNSVDLNRYKNGDRNVKLARVFRDPSESASGIKDPKFEIWIAFEFEGRHLIDAEVLKSNFLDRPFERAEVLAITIQIARGATADLATHKTDRNDEYQFVDYGRDTVFYVKGSELFLLLDEQLASLQTKSRNQRNGRNEEHPENPVTDSRTSTETIASKSAGELLDDIDSVLRESTALTRDFRATNPD